MYNTHHCYHITDNCAAAAIARAIADPRKVTWLIFQHLYCKKGYTSLNELYNSSVAISTQVTDCIICGHKDAGNNSPSPILGQSCSSDWSLQSGFPLQTNRCWIHLEELAVPLVQLKWSAPHSPVPCTRWNEQNNTNKMAPNISPNNSFPIIRSYNSYTTRK